jgi:iron complex outermembrane receptor protein
MSTLRGDAKPSFTISRHLLVGLCAIAASEGVHAAPQTDAERSASAGQIEEVVVSAKKREQNLQSVGVSAAVISSEAIKDRVLLDAVDLSVATPGLSMNATAGFSGKTNFSLRGVGLLNFSEVNEAAVAVC